MPAGRYAADFREGEVCHDFTDPESGLRVQVSRGFVAFTAYVGVRADHALAGLEELSFKCHWGITWTGWGESSEGQLRPKDWFFWGWDYGHSLDGWALPDAFLAIEDDELRREVEQHFSSHTRTEPSEFGLPRKHWTLEEVIEDAHDVLFELKEALRQSEELSGLLMPQAAR